MSLLIGGSSRVKVVLSRPSIGKSVELGYVEDVTIDKTVEPTLIPTPAVEEDYQILMKASSGALMNIIVSTSQSYASFSNVQEDFYAMFGSMSDNGDYTENQGDGVLNAIPGDPVLLELYDCNSGSCSLVLRKSGYVVDVSWSLEWGSKYIVYWSIKFIVGMAV